MTGDVVLTLAITIGALGLFLWGKLRPDVVGLLVMAALMVTGLVSPTEGVSGFANEALLTVAAMYVLSAGLVRTGTVDIMGRWIARLAGKSEARLLAVSTALVIPLSAFINNTPVVAVMVPVLLGLARRIAVPPSKLLMPVAFAAQLGGSLTLIGTSTNLLVAGLALELGLGRLGLFDVTPPAMAMMAVGVLYLLTIGRWLTPVRQAAEEPLTAEQLRDYVSVLRVEPESPLAGKSLGAARFASEYGLQVVAIERGGERVDAPDAGTVVRPHDSLVVRGTAEHLARIAGKAHLEVSTYALKSASSAGRPSGDAPSPDPEIQIAELMVPLRSTAVGQTLRELAFRTRYGVPVLGIQRHGVSIVERLGEVPLEPGDLLLARGTASDLRGIHAARQFALLGPVALPTRRTDRLVYSTSIFAGVVLLAALDVMPILVAALLGALGMFLTRCVTPEEAYGEVDLMVVVLLASLIPLGLAMQNTGTAEFLAEGLLRLTTPLGLVGTMCALFLLTSLLTELISNNAAALVLTPIAIATATELGVSPWPFVIAVMIAASNAFMTPIGYQTNLFVYGPGGYRFTDFLRVGGPLSLLMLVTASIVIPWFFPF